MFTKITIQANVKNTLEKVWDAYTNPNHIIHWNFASDDWQCPHAENDLRVGGTYKARMEAKDGSFGFDFEAIYSEVIPQQKMTYGLGDGRQIEIFFEKNSDSILVKTIFDAEGTNPIEMQQQGWQAILNNFKTHAETI